MKPTAGTTRQRYARALEESHPAINRSERARIAARAGCDPRCIVRYLRKMPMQSTTVGRVERALRACGYGKFVRDDTPPPDEHEPSGVRVKPSRD